MFYLPGSCRRCMLPAAFSCLKAIYRSLGKKSISNDQFCGGVLAVNCEHLSFLKSEVINCVGMGSRIVFDRQKIFFPEMAFLRGTIPYGRCYVKNGLLFLWGLI